jgi:hypothetical protein
MLENKARLHVLTLCIANPFQIVYVLSHIIESSVYFTYLTTCHDFGVTVDGFGLVIGFIDLLNFS